MILYCNICNGKYDLDNKQPLLLSCFHTFCKECLLPIRSPIDCPLCGVCTNTESCCLPANRVLLDVIESSLASSLMSSADGTLCELHDDAHLATHKCVECNQIMCADLVSVHKYTKTTAGHYVFRIGEEHWTPTDFPPLLCDKHNKELAHLCVDSGHEPICEDCCSHHSHTGHQHEAIDGFMDNKEEECMGAIKNAEETIVKLRHSAEKAQAESKSLEDNLKGTNKELNAYYDKAMELLNKQRESLLHELELLAAFKERVLRRQAQSMRWTADSLYLNAKCVKYFLSNNQNMKAWVLMKQLKEHLEYVASTSLEPKEYADIAFWSANMDTLSIGKVVESSASADRSRVEKVTHNCLKVTPCNAQGQLVSLDMFDVEVAHEQKNQVDLKVKGKKDGTYEVFAKQKDGVCEVDAGVSVKYQGHHVRGSPVCFHLSRQYTWSSSRGKNVSVKGHKITSMSDGGWCMIQEEFGMEEQILYLKIFHHETSGWAQLALYESADVELTAGDSPLEDALEAYNCYNLKRGGKNLDSFFVLQREEDGQIALFYDGTLVSRKEYPVCYVYVDIFPETTQAELF